MRALPERRGMVEMDHPKLSIKNQCELLDIHRSGLYYTPTSESKENLQIMKLIDEQYFKTPFYGVERLLVLFQTLGFNINRKRLRRLMKIVNWKTLYPEMKTTKIDKAAYKFPYLLKGLAIDKPNKVWEIDITYIPMKNGFMYLFAIIDIHSRYVVGWSLSNSMTAEWCIDTIRTAISKFGKPEIINSDQGSQFTSKEYIEFLKSHEILISMDGKGRAIDNIFIERFWRTVKYEHVYLYVYDTVIDLRNGLNKYFKFYNKDRMHQSLGYKTPQENYFSKAA